MNEFIASVMPYLISLTVAALVYLKTYFEMKKVKEQVNTIEDIIKNGENDYFVICPNCNQRIDLANVKIYISKKASEDKKEENDNGNNDLG